MKINRPASNILPLAYGSVGTERTTFGTTDQSDALEDNLNSNIYRGWGVVGANDFPPKQWFNAVLYTVGGLLTHLYQSGIPEWEATQEYYIGSITNYDGRIYTSLTGSDTTPNKNKQPDTSPNDWKSVLAQIDASDIISGIIAVARLSGTYDIDISGHANTATKASTLLTARTIGLSGGATGTATSFNGSANITIPVTDLNASNLTSGTVPSARLSGTYPISVSGNAATATSATSATSASTAAQLTTARTIAISGAATGTATSFNGTANITIPVTALNATNLTAGTVPTARLSGTYPIDISGNASTTTKLATARTIGIGTGATGTATSFDGSRNITIPITAINATYLTSGTVPTARLSGTYPISVSGNAATATKLATGRYINGVYFDGTANITLPAGGVSAPISATWRKMEVTEFLDPDGDYGTCWREYRIPNISGTWAYIYGGVADQLVGVASANTLIRRAEWNTWQGSAPTIAPVYFCWKIA